MKNLAVAAAFAAFALSPASAQTACTSDNLNRMTERMYVMPYGPKKNAIVREMAIANADASHGDMRGACAHYELAVRIQNSAGDHFDHLHFE